MGNSQEIMSIYLQAVMGLDNVTQHSLERNSDQNESKKYSLQWLIIHQKFSFEISQELFRYAQFSDVSKVSGVKKAMSKNESVFTT